METIHATAARAHFFELLKASLKKNKLFRIPYKDGNAILISEEEYESLLETLYLLSSPGFRKAYQKSKREIKTGKTIPMEKVFSRS